ncbi:MAG: T9SS type A sorting domain-containing protein [Calditrichaeota bacterium]|nr:T9SS type A sorting domain-containing protein [Calditrichota bacterium]
MLSNRNRSFYPGGLLAAVLTVALFGAASARILNVPFEYGTIQMAVDSSRDGDTVLVAPGRYRENVNLNLHHITLASQFLTTGEERFIAETVIDGGWNGRSAVRMASGESGVLTGFTIENDSTDFGAGVYVRFGSPTLSHLIIQDCFVVRNGTAIYVTGAALPTIRNVVMRRNRCDYVGGAMSIFGGSQATIENCLIYDNYSNHVGGAFHINNAALTLRGCTIVRNAALHTGGAVYLTQGASCNATNCIMWENEPDEAFILGGFESTLFYPSFCVLDGGQERIFAFEARHIRYGVGNIEDDPRFADIAERDFRLTEDSPCIDAGSYESPPDIDGTRRDIGCYYFHQEAGGQRVRQVPATYGTIQSAIDAAVDGDVVLVQPGLYRENINYRGKGITLASRAISTGIVSYRDSTIIDGGNNNPAVIITNPRAPARLSGFTVRNGRYQFGGGICAVGNFIRLDRLRVANNYALGRGGGIWLTGGNQQAPILNDVIIENNEARDWGGGLYIADAMAEEGAALNNVIVKANRAANACGIYVQDGNAALSECQLIENEGDSYGILATTNALVHIDRTLISQNRCGTLIHDITSSNMTINRSTICDNPGGQRSVSIWWQSENLSIRNSILRNQDSLVCYSLGGINIDYSNIDGMRERILCRQPQLFQFGEHNFDADPQFVNPDNGDYRLSENSPCIDAGDPAAPLDPDGSRADVGAYYFHQVIERQPFLWRVPGDFATIQTAIDAALPGDTILVAPGRYNENLNYNGKLLVVGSWFITTRNPRYIWETIIDGGRRDVIAKFMRNEGFQSQLSGFTLTNGYSREGGALFCFRASPTISYCVITGNSAREGGGGVYVYGAGPILLNLTIVGNSSASGAGGIHLRNAAGPTLRNSIVRGNVEGEVVFSADRDQVVITVYYSNILGGEQGVILNDNGMLTWEEGNIDEDPLFVDAERGDYRLSAGSPCIDVGDPASRVDADSSRADIGALAFDNRIGGEQAFTIQMRRGWNLIASPIPPADPAMPAVWRELVENNLMQLVKDQDGRFYWPAQDFNNIPGWDARQGYFVKMNDFASLMLNGVPLPPEEPIALREGWSMVSYLPPDPAAPQDAVANIVNDLLILKDGYGRFYVPRFDWTNLPPLERGKGYQMKMARARELVWGAGDGRVREMRDAKREAREPQRYQPVAETGMNMSLLLNLKFGIWNLECLEMGIFTQSGLCVNASTFQIPQSKILIPNSKFQIGIAVWGDDPTTLEIDGASEGECLTFKVWDGRQEHIVDVEWLEGNGEYRTDGFCYGQISNLLEIPAEFRLYSPFPNPFNNSVSITFDIPEAAEVHLAVYDLSGRRVATLIDGRLAAGRYTRAWQAENAAAGLYILRLKAGNERRTCKMMMLK